MSSTTQNQNYCDYCHQKPKHKTFQYCGRTCSIQASASLHPKPPCKQCQRKPRYQTFEFCGKHCASVWKASNPGGAGTGGGGGGKVQPANNYPANPQVPAPPINITQPQQQNQIPNPQVPLVPPSINVPKVIMPLGPLANILPTAVPPVVPVISTSNPQQTQPAPVVPNTAQASTGICLIAGCGKPVFTIVTGQPSAYCSQRHREEAVATGIAEPCLMCKKLPRSATDHFCSKVCRDEALAP